MTLCCARAHMGENLVLNPLKRDHTLIIVYRDLVFNYLLTYLMHNALLLLLVSSFQVKKLV